MKNELDLQGLRLVLAGYILELIAFLFVGRATTGLMNGGNTTAVILGAVTLVAMLLLARGLSMLRPASFYYAKAVKHVWIRAVIAVLAIVFFAIAGRQGNWTAANISNMQRGVLLEVTIVLLVVAAIWLVAVLFTTRLILRGCGHVAEQTQDPVFSLRCMKTWRLWNLAVMLVVLVFLASIAIMITVLRKTLESGVTGQELQEAVMTNVASSALLASIIVLVVLVFFLIAHVLFLLRIRTTYRTYHLEEIVPPEEAPPLGYEGLEQYALHEEDTQEEETAAVQVEEEDADAEEQ